MDKIKDIIENKYKNYELKLEHEFEKALTNKDFTLLVNKLKIPKKILMMYTSRIEHTINELQNCKTCDGLACCKNEMEGHINYPNYLNDNNLIFEYVPCRYKKEQDKKNKYKENIALYNMPKMVRDASMKNIHTDDKNRFEVIKWLKNFLDNYDKNNKKKGLYLTGSFGCGKTYLISAMLNELAKKDHNIAIVYFPDFLRSLKAAFGDNDEYNETFETVRKAEILLLDDIGAEAVSSWGRDEILGTILQYRMEEGLATFFTSNLKIEELEDHLSSEKNKVDKLKARRITERIKCLADEIIMVGINKR